MIADSPSLALAAAGWPLAAGLSVVLWSKVRAAARLRREHALTGELARLYRGVEASPVPERLALVVEALEEADAMAAQAPPVGRPRRASAAAG
jgi:hypothetical protein